MAPPLFQLSHIGLRFGAAELLEDVDLSVAAGERVCLVGRNGSGKSTLLRIAAGLIEPDRGSRFVQPGATLCYLPQEPEFSGHRTTLSYVQAGLAPAESGHHAIRELEKLGLTGDEDPRTLSGGEARRAALARVLAPDPDILFLDEPTNHLDLTAIEALEARLSESKVALVLISHDRRFLENLTRTTVWLDRGRARRVDLGFGAFEAWRDEQLAEEEVAQHKLDRKIVAEEHWVRYGVTARRKRNVRRMADLAALRQKRNDWRKTAGKAAISASEADKSGAIVVEAKGLSKSYDGRPIVKDLTLRIMRADRIGIVGPNGSGKTTLVNLLTGQLAPDEGTVRLGANLEMATLEQGRESLDPDWTLARALSGGRGDTVVIGGTARHVVSYMKDFLFAPDQAQTPLRALSGGERARLMLARALARPSNVLVLDEPTNDLDLETLDVLEELLASYKGTVILISHDRDFLDRVVTAVLVPEGDGRWTEYAGGYADVVEERGTAAVVKQQKTKAAVAPAKRPADKPAKRKLAFHEKHALETLPGEIEALSARVGDLQKRLADPGLYARDQAAFETLTKDFAEAQSALAAAEERWLALEILREELENG